MSDIIGSVIGGVIGGVSDVVNQSVNSYMQGQALRMNQENISIARDREDTAVQRRVNDLRAAGLSPTLAAGSPAQTMAPMKLDAPEMSVNPGASFLNSFAKAAQIQQTAQQIKLNEQQVRNSKLDADLKEQVLDQQVAITGLKRESLALANQLSEEINPSLVNQMKSKAVNMNLEETQRRLAIQSANLGIDQQQLDIVASQIANRILKTTQGDSMMNSKYDAVIKGYLLDQIEMTNKQQRTKIQEHPTDRTFDLINRVIDTLRNGTGAVQDIKDIVQKSPTVIKVGK